MTVAPTGCNKKAEMRNPKQIAEIVQSEYIWSVFVRSKLFMYAAPNEAVLNQAHKILETSLSHYSKGHPERKRKERALERLENAIRTLKDETFTNVPGQLVLPPQNGPGGGTGSKSVPG